VRPAPWSNAGVAETDDSIVLGIDAAWTEGQPSGVALIQRQGRRWRCLAVTPSYASFIEASPGTAVDWEARPSPGRPDMNRIIAAATRMAGRRPDVIAADMPLSTGRITGRRAADTLVSREFGARKCGTHSPSEVRPGPLSEQIRDGSRASGYALACAGTVPGAPPAPPGVDPHPGPPPPPDAPGAPPTQAAGKGLDPTARVQGALAPWALGDPGPGRAGWVDPVGNRGVGTVGAACDFGGAGVGFGVLRDVEPLAVAARAPEQVGADHQGRMDDRAARAQRRPPWPAARRWR